MAQPLGNKLLISVFKPEEKTKGGILIPETAKRKAGRGLVVEVSKDVEMAVQKGDTILFAPEAGAEISLLVGEEEKPFLLITTDDLWLIV